MILYIHVISFCARHNDLPIQMRMIFDNHVNSVDLMVNGSKFPPAKGADFWHTDIPRLRAGFVGAQVLLLVLLFTRLGVHFLPLIVLVSIYSMHEPIQRRYSTLCGAD